MPEIDKSYKIGFMFGVLAGIILSAIVVGLWKAEPTPPLSGLQKALEINRQKWVENCTVNGGKVSDHFDGWHCDDLIPQESSCPKK